MFAHYRETSLVNSGSSHASDVDYAENKKITQVVKMGEVYVYIILLSHYLLIHCEP